MKTYNLLIKKTYIYLIGLFWISFFIYFRFLRKRNTYYLAEVAKSTIAPHLIYLNVMFISLHLFLILYAIYIILYKTKYSSKNIFILKIQNMFDILIIKPLEAIRDLIAPQIPGSGLFYCKVANFIEENIELRSKLLVISFYFIPRILLALIFFIELVFYNKIEYFIYSLFLILIPLTWSLFVNLFTNFWERGILNVQQNVKVIGIGEPESNGWYARYKFQPLPQFHYEEGELKEWSDTWNIVLKIYAIGNTFSKTLNINYLLILQYFVPLYIYLLLFINYILYYHYKYDSKI